MRIKQEKHIKQIFTGVDMQPLTTREDNSSNQRLFVQFPSEDALRIKEITAHYGYDRAAIAARNAVKVAYKIFKSNPTKFLDMINS